MSEEKRGRGRPRTTPGDVAHLTLRVDRKLHRQIQAAAGLLGKNIGTFIHDAVAAIAAETLRKMGIDPESLPAESIEMPQTGNRRRGKMERD